MLKDGADYSQNRSKLDFLKQLFPSVIFNHCIHDTVEFLSAPSETSLWEASYEEAMEICGILNESCLRNILGCVGGRWKNQSKLNRKRRLPVGMG